MYTFDWLKRINMLSVIFLNVLKELAFNQTMSDHTGLFLNYIILSLSNISLPLCESDWVLKWTSTTIWLNSYFSLPLTVTNRPIDNLKSIIYLDYCITLRGLRLLLLSMRKNYFSVFDQFLHICTLFV